MQIQMLWLYRDFDVSMERKCYKKIDKSYVIDKFALVSAIAEDTNNAFSFLPTEGLTVSQFIILCSLLEGH